MLKKSSYLVNNESMQQKICLPKGKFLESLGCHQPTNGKLVGTSTAFPQ